MAEAAITDVWGVQPRHVREGGTMPITAFLETLLKAPAIHLPLGQATDNAHLPNERIRYLNLINGKEVIKRILRQVHFRKSPHNQYLSRQDICLYAKTHAWFTPEPTFAFHVPT